jgi:hypothetical protein
MEKMVQQLQRQGQTVKEKDLSQIWTTGYLHINGYGRYQFELEYIGKGHLLRS